MLLLKVIGKVLSYVRYYNKQNAFKLFNEMDKGKYLPNKVKNNKGNILILPIRVTPDSNLFEGLIGYSLVQRGFNVFCLLDGGSLKYSENINANKNKFFHNCLSVYEQSRFHNCFGLSPLYFRDLIKKDEIRKVQKEIATLSCKDLMEFTYKDIHIGLHAKFGLMRYLMVETIQDRHAELLKEFIITALKTQLATEQAILKTNPKFALLSHGCYSTWGTALEVLKYRGVEVSVWGRGYVGSGNLLVSNGDAYANEYVYEENSVWENEILSSKEKHKVLDYFSQKRRRGNTNEWVSYYHDCQINGTEFSRLEMKCRNYKTNIGVYPNIPWDGTMFSGSINYPTIRRFVESIKEYIVDNTDVHFIVRIHPAEIKRKGEESVERFEDVLNSTFEFIPKNVTIIYPQSEITSYQVSEICDAALLYGSTLAIEFAIAKHPVIQVGKTNTSNKGIVFEVKDDNDLYSLLNKSKEKALSMNINMHERAIKYAYHWIFVKHIPETLIKLKDLSFKGFLFSSKAELEVGQNAVLDNICNCLSERKPVLYRNIREG